MACVIKVPKCIFMQTNLKNADMATISIHYAKTSPTGEDFQILSNMYFCYLPLEKDKAPHLNKFESQPNLAQSILWLRILKFIEINAPVFLLGEIIMK